MANPFAANDPAKLAAQRERRRSRRGNRAGGGGGGGGGGNRNRHPHRGGKGGGGSAATNDATTAFAKADPQAFFRGLLQQAGFDPTGGAMADFWATQGADFGGAWNTYTTNPANVKKTIFDFAQEQYGIPKAYLDAQNAKGGYVPNPLDWETFKQRMLANVYAANPQARGMDMGKQPGNTRYNLYT